MCSKVAARMNKPDGEMCGKPRACGMSMTSSVLPIDYAKYSWRKKEQECSCAQQRLKALMRVMHGQQSVAERAEGFSALIRRWDQGEVWYQSLPARVSLGYPYP